MNYRVMVVRYGYATVEADTESEALEKTKGMSSHDFDWSDFGDAQVVETEDEDGDNGKNLSQSTPCDYGECPHNAEGGYDCRNYCGLGVDE